MVDALYPHTGMAVVDVLEHFGVAVDFPMAQTCCGQPGFNAGYWDEAKQVAAQFLRAFADAELIVTPSGSCAAMVRHEYPPLFADDPALHKEAQRLADITWEFTEFLVDGLEIADWNTRLPEPTTFAFHDACHGLRVLGLGEAGRQLIGRIENADIIEMDGHDTCCGFGGLFSVKMAAISGAMLDNKMTAIRSCPAQVLCGDVSCMTHINGGLDKNAAPQRVQHIADIVAAAIKAGEQKTG
jgi:L-lactate dehydrogenase complex protein LldE